MARIEVHHAELIPYCEGYELRIVTENKGIVVIGEYLLFKDDLYYKIHKDTNGFFLNVPLADSLLITAFALFKDTHSLAGKGEIRCAKGLALKEILEAYDLVDTEFLQIAIYEKFAEDSKREKTN